MENDKPRGEAEAVDSNNSPEPTLSPLGIQIPLGMVFITERAMEALTPDDVFRSLGSHSLGYGGDWTPPNREDHTFCLRHGLRLYSQFESHGTKFWILTEHDRTRPSEFLPDEF